MRLFRTPIWLHRWFGEYTWKIQTTEKAIYLTFDDGPDPEVTTFVLEALREYRAQAVFFCVGENLRKYPHIKHLLIQEGHAVGNHTQHHLKGWNTSNEIYVQNILECEKHIGTEHSKLFFRPPYGRIRKSQGKWLKRHGYNCIMWDILTYDYDAKLDLQYALKHISQKTRNGSIVVFHDSKKSFNQLKFLLPKYLQIMSEKGYTFKLIPTEEI